MTKVRQLGEKGQIVIPKEIRERFGLKTGSSLRFEVEDEKIVVTPAPPGTFMEDFTGIVKKKRTRRVDLRRLYEEEIEERHPA
jgi:AbrB family looped-hinge helix DNA binding protein